MSVIPSSVPKKTDLPLGRRERRKLEVRTRVYAAARTLFSKQGFEATTVDEIAEMADVAPATFFNHFQSKQAIHAMITKSLVGHGSSLERIRRFITGAANDISASRGAARETLLEFMRLDATPNVPHPYLDRIFEPIVALIAEGQAAGEIRSDRDAVFLTQMTVGMINSAVTNWLAHPDYAVEEGLLEAMEFAIATLRPTD